MGNHQELLATKTIVAKTKRMSAIFVSHQWLGNTHPDKNMKQFKALQEAVRNLIKGVPIKVCPTHTIRANQKFSKLAPESCSVLADAYVWYDYFGVPQVTT